MLTLTRVYNFFTVKAEEKTKECSIHVISHKMVNVGLTTAIKTIKPCQNKCWSNYFITVKILNGTNCISGWRHTNQNFETWDENTFRKQFQDKGSSLAKCWAQTVKPLSFNCHLNWCVVFSLAVLGFNSLIWKIRNIAPSLIAMVLLNRKRCEKTRQKHGVCHYCVTDFSYFLLKRTVKNKVPKIYWMTN